MKLACKLCNCDMTHEGRCVAGNAYRATVLLTTGNTTDVTVCDCCKHELRSSLTRLRNRCNELLAESLVFKMEDDRRRTGAKAVEPMSPLLRKTAIDMTRVGYLHVFGMKPWKDVNGRSTG